MSARRFVLGAKTPLAMLVALSLAGGCDRGGADADSSSAAGDAPAIELDLVQSVSGYDETFGSISSLVADESGTIFVADEESAEIAVIGPDGSRTATIGRRGEGPGELQRVSSLAWSNGFLLVFDQRAQRLSLFEPSGAFHGTVEWPGEFLVVPTFVLGAGDLAYLYALSRGAFRAGAGPAPTPRLEYARIEPDGELTLLPALVDEARWPPIVECSSSDGRAIFGLALPFSDRGPLRAFLPSGDLLTPSGDEFRVEVIDSDSGETIGTFTRSYSSPPMTDEAWEAVPEIVDLREVEAEWGELFDFRDPGAPCSLEGMKPERWPVIRAVVTDPSGRVWVEATAQSGDGTTTLTLFDADGTVVGEAIMPERDPDVPFYARGNRLYLVTIDELDVQSVEVYEVRLP